MKQPEQDAKRCEVTGAEVIDRMRLHERRRSIHTPAHLHAGDGLANLFVAAKLCQRALQAVRADARIDDRWLSAANDCLVDAKSLGYLRREVGRDDVGAV